MQHRGTTHAVGVLGTGAYLPRQVRTNAQIARQVGMNEEWIVKRTGIHRRHVSDAGQATSDLAAKAVRAALDSAGLAAEDLDLLIVATSTPDELGPSTACRVQAQIGATNAVAFDVSAACSGWLFGTRVAENWLRSAGGRRYAAVVGAETFSRFLDPSDRATAVLFGDGAAATVLGPVPDGHGFGLISLGSDGVGAGDVLIPAGGSRYPATPQTLEQRMHAVRMDGGAVRQFVLDTLPRISRLALENACLAAEDLDLVVAHQPNPVLIKEACAAAGFDSKKVVITGDMTGNIGAASTPYTLAHSHAQGRLCAGDRVLIVSFGAGLTWGSSILTWAGGAAG